MIKMNMPDFITGFHIYDNYFYLKKNYPYVFDPNIEISSIFGCFPNCIWMGGGHFHSNIFYLSDSIERCVEFYNKNNMPIRFTFTNPVLTKEMYHDQYGHRILEIANTGMNEIITSIPDFEKFLQDKYPNYKYVRSIIGTKDEPLSFDDTTYMTVLRRQDNHNWDYLNSIPEEIRPKVELLCNDPCDNDCPRIYSHYRDHGRRQISYGDFNVRTECTFRRKRSALVNAEQNACLPTSITKEQVLSEYLPKGYVNFKISGRFNPGSIIEETTKWFILPEYQSDFREVCVNKIFHFYKEDKLVF